MNLTNSIVKNALETISFTDVEAWLDEVFGQSMIYDVKKKNPIFGVT
ncbi:hypothetical protein [Brunnivagina elsteri]|nr:hypothetical protein [Calothrix elsteri]